MTALLCFAISLIASTVGAISGIGGGVIIKPVLDAFGLMSVSSVSFLSGCAVLSMTSVTYARGLISASRRSKALPDAGKPAARDKIPTVLLGISAALGGIMGKQLFKIVASGVSESAAGTAQTSVLLALTVAVLVYTLLRGRIRSYDVTNRAAGALIGFLLGFLSAFLGIGGGPMNIAALALFFSMDTREAASASLKIIFFSQLASLILTLATGTVPEFDPLVLAAMIVSGIAGGLIGGGIVRRMSENAVSRVFICVTSVVILINIWNLIKFLTML